MEGWSSWRDDEEACVPWVLCMQRAPLEGGWVAGVSVGDHHAGRLRLPVQPEAEKALGRLLIAPLLGEDFRHQPVAVDGPPQPVLRPRARATHRARAPAAPARARRRSSAARAGPNRWHHGRMASSLPHTPRSSESSSASRRLRANRWCSHTVWRIRSAGNRSPRSRGSRAIRIVAACAYGHGTADVSVPARTPQRMGNRRASALLQSTR